MVNTMENILEVTQDQSPRTVQTKSKVNRIIIAILVLSVVLGSVTGVTLAKKGSSTLAGIPVAPNAAPKAAHQDERTFKDFAEGTIKARPAPKNPSEYVEGSHLLVRDNNAYPVALTSSVVDLSEYEGKKVKVYGETQKALKEGWLMDVGRVEVIN